MIDLPKALLPWRSQLGLFPRELAVSLGPLVARLALALGPLRSREARGLGEPDGFDGLSRRGSYERLLATEWLLAEEVPDEFARRAASGEHAFYRLALRQPQGSRRSMVLFDAGPMQVGSPRLGQLAALLALAQRAEAGGAKFGWGVLQAEPRLLDAVTAATVKEQLLSARTAQPGSSDALAKWLAALGKPQAADDLWLVGDAGLAALPEARGASLLTIDDVLEPNARRIQVTVRPAGRPVAQVGLELPEPRQCVRLLRDPFEVAAPAPAPSRGKKIAVDTPPRFGPDGRSLLVRQQDGGLAVYALPSSANQPPAAPMVSAVPPSEQLVAVGWHHRRLSMVVKQGDVYRLRSTGKRGGPAGTPKTLVPHPDKPFGQLAPAKGSLPPLFNVRIGKSNMASEECFFCDGQGQLYSLLGADMVLPIASQVRAVAPFETVLAWVWEDAQAELKRRIEIHDGFVGAVLPCDLSGDGPLTTFFGYGGAESEPRLGGIVAVEHRKGVFRMVSRQSGSGTYPELAAPLGTRVVGVARDARHGGRPALVAIEADGRTLALHGAGFKRLLKPAQGKLAQVTVCHQDPLIAWITEAGEVGVYSLDEDSLLFRVAPGDKA